MKFLEAKILFDFKIGTRVPVAAYIKQSLMATFFLLAFFMVWNCFIPLSNQVIFSAVASSTFLTFVSTSIYHSLSSKIIGGQLIGVLVGVVLWFAWHSASISFPKFHDEVFILALALSTGIALLLMSVLDFEHPPAAGTAMAFVFNPNQPAATDVLFIIVCAILLGITHYWLKKYFLLKDLD